jgi:acyl carrier protein
VAPDGRSTPKAAEIEARILEFLHGEVLSPDVTVGGDDELLEAGLLDSMAALRLSAFVEEAFRFKMQPSDFVVENFQTVGALAGLVRRRLDDGGSAP